MHTLPGGGSPFLSASLNLQWDEGGGFIFQLFAGFVSLLCHLPWGSRKRGGLLHAR